MIWKFDLVFVLGLGVRVHALIHFTKQIAYKGGFSEGRKIEVVKAMNING